MELLNHLRAYHFLAGVLAQQQGDLFCGQCSAWNNTLSNAREGFARFEKEQADGLRGVSEDAAHLLNKTRSRLAGLVHAANPAGQKKAGNCKLPQGVCFVKASFGLLEKV